MIPGIELQGVTRDFVAGSNTLIAVDDLSLRIEAGQTWGILGPNGSGKSTTIKIILGSLAPRTGFCRVFGYSAGSIEARRSLGYVPEAPYYPRHLTARELLRFYAKLCLIPTGQRENRIVSVLSRVGLTSAADRRLGTYSKGMLQRVGIAQAIVHDPALVILDEPSAGLDAEGTECLDALLRHLKEAGKTIVLTSHVDTQIAAWCDHVAVLNHGRLVYAGLLEEYRGVRRKDAIVREFLAPEERVELDGWLTSRGRCWHLVDVENPTDSNSSRRPVGMSA